MVSNTKISNVVGSETVKRPSKRAKPSNSAFVELGRSGEGVFGGYDQHEQLNVGRVTLNQIDTMMEVDGQAMALFNIITLPLRANAKHWDVEPAKSGKREAKFIEDMFRKNPQEGGMSIKLDRVFAQLCMAFAHGFRVFEQVFKQSENEDKIVLDKIAYRSPFNTWLRVDDFGEFDGFAQRVSFLGQYHDVTVPKMYSALFTINDERNPNYGKSMFQSAYYHYDKKHKMYYIAHLAHQLNAIPGRVGKTPRGTKENRRTQFLQMLEKFGFNSSMLLPEGFEVDQFPKTTGRMAPYMEIINHHDVQMAKSVVAQFMELGLSGSTGSWALSKNQFDIFLVTYSLYLGLMEDFFNTQIIPQLIDWNFGTKKYPKFHFRDVLDARKELLKEVFYKIAVDQDPNVSGEFLYNIEKMMAVELGMETLKYENKELIIAFDPEKWPAPPATPAIDPNAQANNPIDSPGQQNSSKNKPRTKNAAGAKQPSNQNPPKP